MGDVKTYIQSVRFNELDEGDICTLFNVILNARNLEQYVNFITFNYNSANSNGITSMYNKENKEIIFDMANLMRDRSSLFDNNTDYIKCSHIVTLYEILSGVEEVALANPSSNLQSSTLKIISSCEKDFKEEHYADGYRYFDINDKDIKVYIPSRGHHELYKTGTISPLLRYQKVKPIYDTIDIFTGLKPSCKEIASFYKSNVDLLYNGYSKESNTVTYPLYNYFTQRDYKEGGKILKHFFWYSDDNFISLYNASAHFSEKERIIYGMPIDICEYNSIRNRYKG